MVVKILTEQIMGPGCQPGRPVTQKHGLWEPMRANRRGKTGWFVGSGMVVVGELVPAVAAAKQILQHLNSGGE